jgi:hypothetical protein
MKDVQAKGEASKKEHPALRNIKISSHFLFLWVIFDFLGPDSDPPMGIRIHNTAQTDIQLLQLIFFTGSKYFSEIFALPSIP